MSKGRESKSVEQQQAEAASRSKPAIDTSGTRQSAEQQRRIQELELQRERILNEQTSNSHRRNALQMALATVERDLQELGWLVKL